MKSKVSKAVAVLIAVSVVLIMLMVFYPSFKNPSLMPRLDVSCDIEAAVCEIGEVLPCGDGNGTKKCTVDCNWSRCVCNHGYKWDTCNCKKHYIDCDASQKPLDTRPCGNCGMQTRTIDCDGNGNWTDPLWPPCQEPEACP